LKTAVRKLKNNNNTPVLCIFCSLCVLQHCATSVTVDSSVNKDTSEEDGMQ